MRSLRQLTTEKCHDEIVAVGKFLIGYGTLINVTSHLIMRLLYGFYVSFLIKHGILCLKVCTIVKKYESKQSKRRTELRDN